MTPSRGISGQRSAIGPRSSLEWRARVWHHFRGRIADRMKYVIYCDESRHNGPDHHRYMAIGGLWVPEPQKLQISRNIRQLSRSLAVNSEAKWNKVSKAKLDGYKGLVDAFFDCEDLRYRVIVVDQSKVDCAKFNQGDAELGFYKFYYQMLKHWILQGNDYLVLLDRKQNSDGNRYRDLRRILGRRAQQAGASIRDLTVVDSARTPLIQICDLLTGSVAASCCGDIKSAKAQLAEHVVFRAGLFSLKLGHSSPAVSKFNIFKIRLG